MNYQEWKITNMPDFDDEYLHAVGTAFIRLNNIDGEFKFGYVEASFLITKSYTLKGAKNINFNFEGTDELDSIFGNGNLKLTENNKLEGIFNFHQSDSYKFIAKRIQN